MTPSLTRTGLAAILVTLFAVQAANAQIERRRADPSGPVDELFWAPTLVTTASVTNIPRGNLNVTIMHAFGLVSDGVDEWFGMDAGANIRIGLDYGLTDRISIGIGRSRLEKVVDLRTKVSLLRQSRDGRMPVEVAVKGDLGIRTERNGLDFADRLSYLGAVLVARRMSDRVSLQLTPMVSHFNTVFIEVGPGGAPRVEENTHVAVGLGARLVLTDRLAVLAEYIPVLGERSDGTRDAMAVGLDIETGGHVFQLFFTSSQWLTEQHVVARNVDDFLAGDFRIGFNVNRVFGPGG
jgi:hypothetical protein